MLWAMSDSAANSIPQTDGPLVRRFRVALCHSSSAEVEPSVFVKLAAVRQSLHPCK
jgi:hypothetical protein